jgi:hypothetical protein
MNATMTTKTLNFFFLEFQQAEKTWRATRETARNMPAEAADVVPLNGTSGGCCYPQLQAQSAILWLGDEGVMVNWSAAIR